MSDDREVPREEGPAPSAEGGGAPGARGEPGHQLSQPAGADALAALEGFEFVIERDGTVTFVDFPPELVDIAYALNPDDPLVCERRALLRGDGGADTGGSDAPEDRSQE